MVCTAVRPLLSTVVLDGIGDELGSGEWRMGISRWET